MNAPFTLTRSQQRLHFLINSGRPLYEDEQEELYRALHADYMRKWRAARAEAQADMVAASLKREDLERSRVGEDKLPEFAEPIAWEMVAEEPPIPALPTTLPPLSAEVADEPYEHRCEPRVAVLGEWAEDRTSCPWCEVRADVGCRHRRVAA